MLACVDRVMFGVGDGQNDARAYRRHIMNNMATYPYTAIFDYDQDLDRIGMYNARRSPASRTRLQIQMGAAPYDGDPHTARVILLLNNPVYTPGVSKPTDHLLAYAGWPLAGLHPDAPPAFRLWYQRPLGRLISDYGAQHVSKRVCLLQLCPWASQAFDLALVLPSRSHQIELAHAAVQRGAVVIAGRSFGAWPAGLPRVRNRLNPTLTPNGLDEGTWNRVEKALG